MVAPARGVDEERRRRQKEQLCVTERMSKLFTQDTVSGYCVHAKPTLRAQLLSDWSLLLASKAASRSRPTLSNSQ